MAYILVLLGLLGAFVWVSPAKDGMRQSLADSPRALISIARTATSPLAQHGSQLLSKIREKAMELVRQQLHNAIDSQVK